MTITSTTSGVISGSTTNDATIDLMFTASEPSSNFDESKVTVTNGSLSTISRPVSYFTDAAMPGYNVNWDVSGATGVQLLKSNHSDYSNDEFIQLGIDYMNADSTIKAFMVVYTDNVRSGIHFLIAKGNISNLGTDNNTTTMYVSPQYVSEAETTFERPATLIQYTATVIPTSNGMYTIDVNEGAFTDAAGNNNTASNTFTWTYDGTSPTMTITSTTFGVTDGSTTNDSPIDLTFTASEDITNFAVSDISANGGAIDTFESISNRVYTAKFTPGGDGLCRILVNSDTFTDAAGNNNTVSNTFTWTYDGTRPTMIITAVGVNTGNMTTDSTTNDASLTLTFTASEDITNFIVGDITRNGGSVDTFTEISANKYTAIFTPYGDGPCSIVVPENKFQDMATNENNVASNTFIWTYDGTSPVVNSVTTDTTNGSYKAGQTIDIQISFSETIIVSGGIPTLALNAGTNSKANYELGSNSNVLTFQYSIASGENVDALDYSTINALDLSGATIMDAAGNNANLTLPQPGSGNSLAGTKTITIDTTPPTMTITSTTFGVTDGSTTNDSFINLKFVASEATSNFTQDNITVTGGIVVANSFTTISSTIYVARFTPSGSGACTIDVTTGSFTDAVGNDNITAIQFNWTYDGSQPTIINTASRTNVSYNMTTYVLEEDLVVYDQEKLDGTLGIHNSDLSNAFTFCLNANYGNIIANENVDVSFNPTSNLFYHTTSQINSHRVKYLKNVALNMFGSEYVTDFLFNGQQLMDQFNEDISQIALKRSNGLYDNYVDKKEISKELYNSMLHYTPERFRMDFMTHVSSGWINGFNDASNSILFGEPIYSTDAAININQANVISHAKAVVEIDSSNSEYFVKNITIVETGSGYKLYKHGGGDITINLSYGNAYSGGVSINESATVTISAEDITPIQISLLNNTIHYPTSFPFRVGDKIRTKVTIKPASGQMSVNKYSITNGTDYSVFCDYEVMSNSILE